MTPWHTKTLERWRLLRSSAFIAPLKGYSHSTIILSFCQDSYLTLDPTCITLALMDNLTEIVNIRLNPAMRDRLIAEARQRDLNLSQLIRLVLAEWLVEGQSNRNGVRHDTTA